MRKLSTIAIILIALILLSSCDNPNIYDSLGLYDPLEGLEIRAEVAEIKQGSEFNLLSLSENYSGAIRINYTPAKDHIVFRQLEKNELTKLIQSLYYVTRYGDIEEYLAEPLDSYTKSVSMSTKELAYWIIDDIRVCVLNITQEIKKIEPELNLDAIDEFFLEFQSLLSPESGCSTRKDYIAIQLTVDMLSSMIDMLYRIIIELPGDVTEYVLPELAASQNFWNETTASVIKDNAVTLTRIFIDAVAEIDQVGSDIPSFINLSSIIEAFL